MAHDAITLTPVQQAEQIRQVVGVLRRMEYRFADPERSGFRMNGGVLEGVDEATGWVLPGVADEVTERLAAGLPFGLRSLAAWRPRLALALYSDTVGGRSGGLRLVRDALSELGLAHQPRRSAQPGGLFTSREAA